MQITCILERSKRNQNQGCIWALKKTCIVHRMKGYRYLNTVINIHKINLCYCVCTLLHPEPSSISQLCLNCVRLYFQFTICTEYVFIICIFILPSSIQLILTLKFYSKTWKSLHAVCLETNLMSQKYTQIYHQNSTWKSIFVHIHAYSKHIYKYS